MNKKIQESWKPQIVCLVVFGSLVTLFSGRVSGEESRRLPVAEYRDRMAAGWIGQVVGVGWGAPTEFRFKGEIDMGLLYGERRMEDTIVVSMRCGQDSDCNP